MKKLLFSLVAAAACGAVTADNVPATATFDSLTADATFDVGKTEDQTAEIANDNLGYWAVNMATDPELTVKDKSESDKYLSLNTGSTPLWRTFTGIGIVDNAKAGTLPAGVGADGKVVSSDVKLTACTEWPTLTDFANEKLALFLFVPEEGDTSGNGAGLYAVGGAMVTPEGESTAVLTNKAYKLTVEGNANITNGQGWATISIKTYGDIYKTSGNKKVSGFVIAVGGVIATRTETTGFAAEELTAAAATRNDNGTLIPAALATTDATIAGLGFQGEGGIDNVNLFAEDFAIDAVAMTVVIPEGVDYEGITLGENGAYSFTSTGEVTFTLKDVAGKIVTVDYGDNSASYNKDSYKVTFTPVKDATLTITVEDAKFMVGETPYANFAAVLTAIEDGTITGGEIDLLADASAGEDGLAFENGTFTIDLNGFTLSAVDGEDAIYNNGATLTIIDSSELKTGVVAGTVYNNKGTLVIDAGTFNDEVTNKGSLTINGGKFEVALVNTGTLTDNGGMFKETDGLPEVAGKEYRDDDKDSYYTLEDKAGEESEVPSVGKGEGSVTVDETSGDATVAPAEGKTEVTITLPTGFAGNVIVPSSLDKIVGVPAGKLVIKSGSFDVTGAFSYDTETGAIALNAEATVNGVPVKPVLDTTVTDPFVGGATPAAKVKTIPGLKYSLTYATDVGATTYTEVTTPAMAEDATMTLTDTRTAGEGEGQRNPNKGFYKVKVSK